MKASYSTSYLIIIWSSRHLKISSFAKNTALYIQSTLRRQNKKRDSHEP